MTNFDKHITPEILKELGIYELRELARNLGVSSPTTKKREELCELILKISAGEIVEKAKTNKGRPPKSVTKIASFVKEFIPDDILSLQQKSEPEFATAIKFSQNLASSFKDEQKQAYGFVNAINGNFFFKNLRSIGELSDLIFYIPSEISEKYSLRVGDKILCNGRLSQSAYCGIVDEIVELNNEKIGDYEYLKVRQDIDLNQFEIPNKELTVFNKKIKSGERVLSFFGTTEDAITQILKDCNNPNERYIFIGLEIAPEIIFYTKSNEKIEIFATSYYNSLEENHEAVINAINHANTLLRDGHSVRIILFDVINILKRLDLYFSDKNSTKYLDHSLLSVQLVKKIVGMGKAIADEVAITTETIAFENERRDKFITTELDRIITEII